MKLILVILTVAGWLPLSGRGSSLDELSESVVFLITHTNGSARIGTGVLLATDIKHPFLATAEHVARTLNRDSEVVMRANDGNAFRIRMGNIMAGTNAFWRFHDTADLALLPITVADDLEKELTNKGQRLVFLPAEVLRAEESAPSRSITITVLGFPLALGTSGPFSPISRETRPASGFLTVPRFDTHRPALFFLTQDPSIGGFSGAPVFDTKLPLNEPNTFTMRGGGPRIVGIVHGTLSDRTGGKLGAVTPAHELLALLKRIATPSI
jgi:hypothetical protein